MKSRTINLLTILVISILSFFYFNSISKKLLQPKTSGALEALQQWSFERSYPDEKMSSDNYYKAFEFKSAIKKTANANFDSTKWEEIGPHNIGGRTISLAINPQNTNTIFAGSASGGLWKSTSAGEGADAWERINTNYPVLGVGAIAINPLDSNEMFIGTGEVYNYQNSEGGVAIRETRGSYGVGILKTNDAGKTWTKSLDWSYNQERGVMVIRYNPLNPRSIFAGTTEGVFHSIDGGANWNLVHDVIMVTDLVINPIDTNIVISACGNLFSEGNGIYKSADAGASWNKITSGLPSQYGGKALFSQYLAADNLLYVSIGNGYSSGAGTWLCKSTDNGDNWTTVTTFDYATYQGWFAHIVVLDETDPTNLLTAGVDIYKSTDGGTTLSRKSDWAAWYFGKPPAGGPEGPSNYSHADHHCYAVNPQNPNIVYFGNDGGVFRTADFGETFTGLNGGYQTTQFYNGFVASHSDSSFAIGGMQDNSTAYTKGSLDWYRAIGGDGAWAAINQSNDNTIYGSWQRLNILKSTNQGSTWRSLSVPSGGATSFIAPYVVSYVNPNVMYAARSKVFKSVNGGSSWSVTNGGSELSSNPAISMDISHFTSQVVYVTTAPVNEKAGVFKTTDGGSSWQNISEGLPDRYPMDIEVGFSNHDLVYVVFSGFGTSHVYKSTNGGNNWEDVGMDLPDVPTNSVAIDPSFSDYVYVGTDLGIFVSTDGGSSWNDFNNGLPQSVIVKSLAVSPANRSIKAATHGMGVFEKPLLDVPLSVNDGTEIVSGYELFQNYPNPFNPTTKIKFTIPKTGNVVLKVYDVLGREITTLVNEVKLPGEYEISFSGLNIAAGVYIYKLHSGSISLSRKMILMK